LTKWQMNGLCTLYSIEKVPESLVTAAKDKPVRVDHYWHEMLYITTAVGEPKYPFLSVLVKKALGLPHSNTNVERSLSVNYNGKNSTQCWNASREDMFK